MSQRRRALARAALRNDGRLVLSKSASQGSRACRGPLNDSAGSRQTRRALSQLVGSAQYPELADGAVRRVSRSALVPVRRIALEFGRAARVRTASSECRSECSDHWRGSVPRLRILFDAGGLLDPTVYTDSTDPAMRPPTWRFPMKFHWFNLMPWPHLPDDFRETNRSVWVDVDFPAV